MSLASLITFGTVARNYLLNRILSRIEFKIFLITGSTGDALHQVAALESTAQQKCKDNDLFLWIIILPSWATEYKYLVYPRKNIRIWSIRKEIHNGMSLLIKAFPKAPVPIVLNHLYHKDAKSEESILGSSAPSLSLFKTPYEHALSLITRNTHPTYPLIWKKNSLLLNKASEIIGQISPNSILLNPVSQTHLGFSMDVWLSIASRISVEDFIPVFTVGKSLSKSSFGYIQFLETRAMCGEHGYELLHTTPLEMMLLGRCACFSISGMGGSCNLVHDFRFDTQLRLGDEKNCMILWSSSQSKYSKHDNRHILIPDYSETEQDLIFERHSQKDCTHRKFVRLAQRSRISIDEMNQILELLIQRRNLSNQGL